MRGFRKAFISEDACEARNSIRIYTAGYIAMRPHRRKEWAIQCIAQHLHKFNKNNHLIWRKYMQTLCKPPRRVYDAKAIEACHNEQEGLDWHDVKHGMTAAALGAVATVATANPVAGAAVGVAVYVSEEQITHTLEEVGNAIADAAEDVWDSISSRSGGSSSGSLPPSDNGHLHGSVYTDPNETDHKNAQSGGH